MLDFATVLKQGPHGIFLWIIWVALVVDMLYRLLPNKRIAMGARKHYSHSFNEADATEESHDSSPINPNPFHIMHKGAAHSMIGWLLITTAILIVLQFTGLLTAPAVLLLMLLYSVGDIIFILFFCPFQKLFMHNKCCVTCRIYNWDYFMMCAPLIVFPSFYSLSLALLSFAVLIRWEIAIHKTPKYFTPEVNKNLRCDACVDRLCKFKNIAVTEKLQNNYKKVDK